MKRLTLCVAVLLVGLSNAYAEKNLLPSRIADGSVVKCNDPSRGQWCDPKNNPLPAWDGTPIRGHAVNPPQQAVSGNCASLSGNQRTLCEKAGTLGPALGIILGR